MEMFNTVTIIFALAGAPVVLLCIFVMLVMWRKEMLGNAMRCEVEKMLKEGNVPVLEYHTSDYRKLWTSRCSNKWFYEIRGGVNVVRINKVFITYGCFECPCMSCYFALYAVAKDSKYD
jgi:hypothetical protein